MFGLAHVNLDMLILSFTLEALFISLCNVKVVLKERKRYMYKSLTTEYIIRRRFHLLYWNGFSCTNNIYC